VNITAAGAAMKSERPLGNTEPGFTASAFAYPHVGFQIVGSFADDSLRRPALAIFAALVIEPAVVSRDITPKHSGTAGCINTDSALTAIVRPRLPATILSAGAQDGCELTGGPSLGSV
jgi:hypothetical protein